MPGEPGGGIRSNPGNCPIYCLGAELHPLIHEWLKENCWNQFEQRCNGSKDHRKGYQRAVSLHIRSNFFTQNEVKHIIEFLDYSLSLCSGTVATKPGGILDTRLLIKSPEDRLFLAEYMGRLIGCQGWGCPGYIRNRGGESVQKSICQRSC